MRPLPVILALLLVLVQYPLWLGKGGWLRTWELDHQVWSQLQSNARLDQRNRALEGEVRDLKQGLVAIEERARYELGMVRPDEIFVQINQPRGTPVPLKPSDNPPQPDVRGGTSELRTASLR
jgi:cell division protein FtsB